MSAPQAAQRLPVLTDEVPWQAPRPLAVPAPAATSPGDSPEAVADPEALLQRALALIEPHLEAALDTALAEAAEHLLRETRAALLPALRECVAHGIEQALHRR